MHHTNWRAQRRYQHWINAVNVGSLGDGVAKLFRGDGTGSKRDAHTNRAFRFVLQSDGANAASKLRDIWSSNVSYFDDVKQRLAQDRTMLVQTWKSGNESSSGHASVDVCCVMDWTGSMGPWIDACKQKVLRLSLHQNGCVFCKCRFNLLKQTCSCALRHLTEVMWHRSHEIDCELYTSERGPTKIQLNYTSGHAPVSLNNL
jgi:hypothetical protein